MKENQQLRCIALKLGVSGTATPIARSEERRVGKEC